MRFSTLEVCAGAGGQALGLEAAGFEHEGLVELDTACCDTLRRNRKHWPVHERDLNFFNGKPYKGKVTLLAGGLPCPPFSVAGKQLGEKDERNLFPAALRLVEEIEPKAVMIENVRGFLDDTFKSYRADLKRRLQELGYEVDWTLLNASEFGVPQLRPRVVIVALQKEYVSYFKWPDKAVIAAPTVGHELFDLMVERGWRGAEAWRRRANRIAPTIVGGSKKHGGPDLGPTRARKAWAELGVNGLSIAETAPDQDFVGMPRLTVRMVARLQGFPDDWAFTGKKTSAYRQVGNAFPPPVACAVAESIQAALLKLRQQAAA